MKTTAGAYQQAAAAGAALPFAPLVIHSLSPTNVSSGRGDSPNNKLVSKFRSGITHSDEHAVTLPNSTAASEERDEEHHAADHHARDGC